MKKYVLFLFLAVALCIFGSIAEANPTVERWVSLGLFGMAIISLIRVLIEVPRIIANDDRSNPL